MKVYWSRQANSDLLAIWRYIAQDNPAAATNLVRRIDDSCSELRDFPQKGGLRRGARGDVRQLVEDEYLIFYRIAANRVEVLRVLHGRRDLRGW